MSLRRLCIYCDSSVGVRPVYADAALDVGRLLAEGTVREEIFVPGRLVNFVVG